MSIANEFRNRDRARPQSTIVRPDFPETYPQSIRSTLMTNSPIVTTSNTAGWITFVYAQFALALALAGWNILSLANIDWHTKSTMVMATIFVIGATFTLAKTVRDEHENKKISARLEDARAEKLLMEVGRG